MDGLLAVRAPRDGAFEVRFHFDRRRRDWVAGLGVVVLGLALCFTGRRKRTGIPEGNPR